MANKPELITRGDTGTVIFSGIITSEEYNRELSGTNGLTTYEKMRRSDSSIAAALKVVKQPIMAAQWRLDAPDKATDEELFFKRFVEWQMERVNWDSFLRQALTMLDFGFYVGEIIWEVTTFEGRELLAIKDIEYRKQTTIFRWETEQEQPGVTQQLVNGPVSIPREKLIIITNEQEGANYAGVSILRPLYKAWYMKDQIEKITAIAIERHSVGVPKLKTPANASTEAKREARKVAQQLRANEKSYAEMPESFEFDFMDMHASGLKDPQAFLNYLKRQIMEGVLAQFLDLGSQGSSGSYNLSVDQSSLFLQALESVAKIIASAFQKDVVTQIHEINGFQLESVPQITFGKVGDQNVTVIADAVQKLMSSQALTPDPEFEEFLRETLRAPKLPDEIKADYENRPVTQPSATPATPAEPAVTAAKIMKTAAKVRANADDLIEDLVSGKRT